MLLTRYIAHIGLLLWTFIAIKALAALPPEPSQHYYGEEFYTALTQDRLQDDSLKQSLREILKSVHFPQDNQFDEIHSTCPRKGQCYSHTLFSYHSARKFMYGELHLEDKPRGGYQVKTFYCGVDLKQSDFPKGNGPGPGRIPDGSITNTEHLWPQSKFNRRESEELQKSDLHILRPVLSWVNTNRSNHPFGEVRIPYKPPCKGVNRGYLSKGNTTVYFEPPNENKGNVARALFYFSVRYNIRIDAKQEEFLRLWHQEDPVDQWEIWRNDQVFEFQKPVIPLWIIQA